MAKRAKPEGLTRPGGRCGYFLRCGRKPTTTRNMGPLGKVAICERCAKFYDSLGGKP